MPGSRYSSPNRNKAGSKPEGLAIPASRRSPPSILYRSLLCFVGQPRLCSSELISRFPLFSLLPIFLLAPRVHAAIPFFSSLALRSLLEQNGRASTSAASRLSRNSRCALLLCSG